ncbi:MULTISPECIES: SDR family oxidoreductase [unclassified Rhizobacter]|uniref:SDR family oxidoreductase n=1 Tax=unclassified Rhizobacter TaxID=2640088 RepID=UPI0006F47D4E|nr:MULTISPECIES: SDR family oxidoreductase [unclassified Rhizobacter]KQU71483.1 short-chain dehydrogenase [Rhizobacter sp. Root29]KQW13027.1 short-chain dehydrogenase [Rhizobacter sp. Root1238]KRB10879.1 short-chain dehydrogenase [Rhizobacter sp. Root16D2]
MTLTNLQNQRVVLLGGTSGIGLATAQTALAAGASVVVVSSRSQRVTEVLAMLGERAEGHVVDLSDQSAVRGLFERLGPFDHLVYSAGESLQIGRLAETDFDAVRKAFDLRLFGAMAAVKHAAPHLRPGGSVVLTGGVASQRPQKGWTVGASICGAMEAFTRALAVELAPIRVNLVSPGFVRTPLWANIPEAQREAMYADVGATLPVGRVGEAQDIAETYLYLMSNRYSTGQVVVVDGGGVLV